MLATGSMLAVFILLSNSFELAQSLTGAVIDLTHPFGENTIAWPTATQFSVTNVVAMQTEGGYWYEARDISQAEHSGTHTDAPAHFYKGSWHTADIPLDHLIAPGVKIDIEERARADPDTELTVADVKAWEDEHGVISRGSIIVVHTGRGKLYGDKQRYFGRPDGVTDEKDTEHLHFPGVSAQAAQWLVDHRGVVGVAIDTPSTDRGQSRTFPTHQVLGKANIWGLENLANSDKLPAKGFTIYNLVHKLEGGSGGPTRVVAVLNPGSGTNGAIMIGGAFNIFIFFVAVHFFLSMQL